MIPSEAADGALGRTRHPHRTIKRAMRRPPAESTYASSEANSYHRHFSGDRDVWLILLKAEELSGRVSIMTVCVRTAERRVV